MAKDEQTLLAKVNAQIAKSNWSAALKAAQTASKRCPDQPEFTNLAGFALAQMGRPKEAAIRFAAANWQAPGRRDIAINLLQALVLSDQHEAAHKLATRLQETQPMADVAYLTAMSLHQQSQPDAALQAIDRAIALDPDQPRQLWLRVKLLTQVGRNAEALATLTQLAQRLPDDITALLQQADILLRQGHIQAADAALDQANARVPDAPDVLMAQGRVALAQGNTAQAVARYTRLIQTAPDCGMGYYQLAKLRQAPDDLQARLSTLSTGDLPPQDAALIDFAKAAIAQQSGDMATETACLKRANRLMAGLQPYDAKSAQRQFDHLTGLHIAPGTSDTDGPVPVFVLGLPRSGTSLVEQILSAAPQVCGGGELGGGEAVLSLALAGQTDPGILAQAYRAHLPPVPPGSTHIIDKLPGNYRAIGLLQAALPNARFLHLDRDPRDTALSMWRAYLAAPDLSYSFDQRAMSQEMALHQRYMTVWADWPGVALHRLRYEDLVQDLPHQAQQAAAFCGIPWDAAMTRPQDNPALIRTASALQARQPVHNGSVGAWRHAQDMLRPFLSALDRTLWPELQD